MPSRRAPYGRRRSDRLGPGHWGIAMQAPRTVLAAGFLTLSALLVWLVAHLLEPFVSSLLWAGVLTLAVYPAYRWFLRVSRFPPTLAAAVTTVSLALAVLGPAVVLGTVLAKESRTAYESVRMFMQGDMPKQFAERLSRVPAELLPALADEDAMVLLQDRINNVGADMLQLLADSLTAGLNRTIGHASMFLIKLFVAMVAVFYFLREGATWLRRARETVPLSPQIWDLVTTRFEATLRAVVHGMLFAAAFFGAALAIGFKVAGVPLAAFFGMLAFFTSPFPFIGPVLVWAPACFWLYATGSTAAALGLFAYGAVLIFAVDNVVRPYIIGSIARLPVLFMLIAILGGLFSFGPLGLFLGPVLLAIAMAVGGIYREIATTRSG